MYVLVTLAKISVAVLPVIRVSLIRDARLYGVGCMPRYSDAKYSKVLTIWIP